MSRTNGDRLDDDTAPPTPRRVDWRGMDPADPATVMYGLRDISDRVDQAAHCAASAQAIGQRGLTGYLGLGEDLKKLRKDLDVVSSNQEKMRASVNRANENVEEGIGRIAAELGKLSAQIATMDRRLIRAEVQSEVAIDRGSKNELHVYQGPAVKQKSSDPGPELPKGVKFWVHNHRFLAAVIAGIITVAIAAAGAWQSNQIAHSAQEP
jgi:hypothetical protein